MIYEYAIDPQFIVDIAGNKASSALLSNSIGIGKGSLVSNYPPNLGQSARQIIKDQLDNAKSQRQSKLEAKLQTRLSEVTELASLLTTNTIKRCNAVNWAGSFHDEHTRFPFYGILKNSAIAAEAQLPIQGEGWLCDSSCHLTNCPRGKKVTRRGADLAQVLKPLLQNASEVTFVDPYFYPEQSYRETYTEFFKMIEDATPVRLLGKRIATIICKNANNEPLLNFEQACKTSLISWYSAGALELCIYRISRLDQGQEIHNRYILTDIGGVSLGHGTGTSTAISSCDDIHLLERDQYIQWRNAYTPSSCIFDWSEPPVTM